MIKELAIEKESEVLKGELAVDHVHMLVLIPSKYAVAQVIGFVKGKSAIRIHRELLKERRMTGLHFWATGYCVSTVGVDEQKVREYVREQEKRDRLEGGQLEFTDLIK